MSFFSADFEVKVGLYETTEKMFPIIATRIKIDQKTEKFKREGLFGMSIAISDKGQEATRYALILIILQVLNIIF